MAIYDYECKNCKTQTTIKRDITTVEQVYNCEQCGHILNRVYTWGGTSFKGKGFYTTDKGDN